MITRILTVVAASRLVLVSCASIALLGCGSRQDTQGDTTLAQTTPTAESGAPLIVRGTVRSASASELVINADTGAVRVTLVQPFNVYARVPSDLSKVQEKSFIGVTTVKQPDGSERATEIHIFPEALRGLGEGSRMMAPAASGGSRMTNGNVAVSRMTNGTASQSRMSNGSVSRTNGSSLVVEYAGGSQNVTVPPNTPVTEMKVATRKLAPGDQVAVPVTKAADGSLTTDKVLFTSK